MLNLGVTLDESYDEENDRKFEVDGIAVVIDKTLHEELKNIEIARAESGGITVLHS